MLTSPAFVDENGDLHLHGRQAGSFDFDFFDDTGAMLDMSAAIVTFEVGPDINVVLTPVIGSTQRLRVTLSNALVKDIYEAQDKQFVLNQSGEILMEGMIYTRGWVE